MSEGGFIQRRVLDHFEEVEVPEGHVVCDPCKGAGSMSAYDRGFRSLMHSPRLAAQETCMWCGGYGYVAKREERHESP